jgi:hypothetical protein
MRVSTLIVNPCPVHFPVKRSLTILPKSVIPRIMPIAIARMIANRSVNLKTRKKRGNKMTQRMIVKQPVAKSFVSIIGSLPCGFSDGTCYEL